MAKIDDIQQANATKSSVKVLEFFAKQSRLTFNRPLASRTVTEMVRAIPGVNFRTWGQRMVEAGESLNLRIRSTDLTVPEAVELVREGIPVAACLQTQAGAGATSAEANTIRWLALTDARGRKIRVTEFDEDRERMLSVRQVKGLLQEANRSGEIRWITGQPALPCSIDVAGEVESSNSIKPLERLFALIRMDRGDISTVFVFSILVGILALATPIAVEALVNTVAFGRYLQPIVILSLILFTFLGFGAAIRALNTYIVEIIQRRLFVRIVEDLAYRLPRVEQEAIDGYHAPELVNRFFDVVTVQKVAVKLLLDGITILLQTILGMAVLAFYHPFLLGFDLVLLLCIGFIVVVLGRGAIKTAIDESAQKYKVAAWLEELARHPTAFKLHGGAQFGLDRSDKLTVDYIEARKSHFRVVMRQVVFALALQAVAATALLGLGGWLVISGELTLGQLVAAELIVMVIVGTFAKLGKLFESFYDLLASVDKLGKLFDLPIERHDKLFHLQDASAAAVSFHSVTQLIGSESLHSGLTFELSPGHSLAVVGSAGAGKSALFDLITGVRHPSGGHISLDAIDLRELRPDSLREHVSLSRDVEIFHGTIEENVHLNRPQINAADVREALEMVCLLDEVMELRDGLSTAVQTNGAPLSASQASRLMIARAIVGRPRLLLIDGTLDRLDDAVAEEILDRISGPKQPWTLIVSTGRGHVVARMQHVLDLDKNAMEENPSQAFRSARTD